MTDDDWTPPAGTTPRFRGVASIARDPDTGLYRGRATVRGQDYDIKATVVVEKDGSRRFACELFEADDLT